MPLLKASDAFADRWEILVYGPPGVGKTTLFADVPNVLYIVVDDNGWIVLQGHPNAASIDLFYTRKWSDLASFCDKLPTSELIKSVETIVVDTVSECQVLERLKQIGPTALADDKWKFNESIYAQNNAKIMALVRKLKATGKNIVWLCHAAEIIKGEGRTAERILRPALSASLLASLVANVDGMFYLDKPGGNRILSTDSSGEAQTKSRFKASRDIVNPTWSQLEKLLTSRMKVIAG